MRPLLLALLVTAVAAPAASAGVDNPADALLRYPIDAPRYEFAKGCAKGAQPGALALLRWMKSRYMGSSWGIFNCRRIVGGTNWSLHAEGRALDWKLDSAVKAQRTEGDRILSLFLRSDSRGNRNALARRMGIQEVIWRCRIWTAGTTRTRFYSPCRNPGIGKTESHRDHLHIGLNWAGARKKTTFWRYAAPPASG